VKLRPATINRQLISVKRYFAWARATQQITRDPSRTVKVIPQEARSPRHLTDQEEHALVAALEQHGMERDRVIVLLLLHAGLRAEELCGLRREQVTLGRRSGHLTIYGKRNKYREVPLNSTVRQVVEPYLAHLPPTVPYLFPSNKGRGEHTMVSVSHVAGTLHEKRADAVNVSALHQPAPIGTRARNHLIAKYAGLTKVVGLSPHDLRHRFGYVLAQTMPLHRLAAQLMGHDSPDTTAMYVHGTLQDLQQAVEQRAWT
jgi:integrase/recombinase XerC